MKRLMILSAALFVAGLLQAQTLGKDARYCNPLPMEIGQGSASGDVSLFKWEGKYYMFCTGGGCRAASEQVHGTFSALAPILDYRENEG